MPRKAFQAHLAALAQNPDIENISDVCKTGDDNEFQFLLHLPDQTSPVKVACMVLPDVSEYPTNHQYQMFAVDDNCPRDVSKKLMAVPSCDRDPVSDLLNMVSAFMTQADDSDDGNSDDDVVMTDAMIDDDGSDGSDDFDGDMYGDEDFGFNEAAGAREQASAAAASGDVTPESRERIRNDLMHLKAAGFKVAYYGGTNRATKCHVCASIRIIKLGISEEAMEAWHVKPHDYLILSITYHSGYKAIEKILENVNQSRLNITFRIGLSHTYKPTHAEVVELDSSRPLKEPETLSEEVAKLEDSSQKGWRDTFISRPLVDLFNSRFIHILDSRYKGMSWAGAELYSHRTQGAKNLQENELDDKFWAEEDRPTLYPAVVTNDHIQDCAPQDMRSFPLLAMQFMLRHFVRCTEFCLVCHCPLDNDLAAIKPYVCDSELCLYQYMSLSFGPSIEHEILTQPLVVDLLISFCYSQCEAGKLNTFPLGLQLRVPNPAIRATVGLGVPLPVYLADIDHESGETLFDYEAKTLFLKNENNFRVGEWVQIRSIEESGSAEHSWRHHRVVHIFNLNVTLSEVYAVSLDENGVYPSSPVTDSKVFKVHYVKYCRNFDDLSLEDKRLSIIGQLKLLPTVEEMVAYLSTKGARLSTWINRISPTALSILRWIIASNRACILQVSESNMIKGMNDETWMQFRFAMGAPDKEKKFIASVQDTERRLRLQHPTIFAWHGSGLANWHSIIREGLHFNEVAHGRAFGNGVYFSPDINTSLGYCGAMAGGPVTGWPRSQLGITMAMALNELVNAPAEFVSSSPHYVVQHLDWIQTRFLFVKCKKAISAVAQPAGIKDAFVQDPTRIPRGDNGNITIPAQALPRSRLRSSSITNASPAVGGASRPKTKKSNGFGLRSLLGGTKGAKDGSSRANAIDLDADDADCDSVATLEEDMEIFQEPAVKEVVDTTSKASVLGKRKAAADEPKTDFVAGHLDLDSLPILPPPQNATQGASKQLMKRFQDLQKSQAKSSLATLGWYMDGSQLEKFENMFQWIVELHTFDPVLPLAKDMKAKGVTSVVLELRFNDNFPFAPPFIRVIRPRLLAFQQGGGGHVTAGGSLCMELLTNVGWLPSMSIESVLISIKHAMSDLDPHPARLDANYKNDYAIGEAVEGYIRACVAHGWKVPDGFREGVLDMDRAKAVSNV
ncbi:hypothetical protein BT63DRAFT_365871 [Microthyrium microscopicum]|uniref:UBC core domain-containing protein n=1 Tax=Microthyrium microscopicum TaxID=703497 RepID=A0A6A6UU52_9PEZI|nr:hypothetical protein BT63DRAFT_365871 [Microthyrium microscopicum]